MGMVKVVEISWGRRELMKGSGRAAEKDDQKCYSSDGKKRLTVCPFPSRSEAPAGLNKEGPGSTEEKGEHNVWKSREMGL